MSRFSWLEEKLKKLPTCAKNGAVGSADTAPASTIQPPPSPTPTAPTAEKKDFPSVFTDDEAAVFKKPAPPPPKKTKAAATPTAPRKRTRRSAAAIAASLVPEEQVSFDAANDSDTSSAEAQDAVRPLIYRTSLKLATEEGEMRKKARALNMLGRPATIHSSVLDDKPVKNSVQAMDFDFGDDRSPQAAVTATTERETLSAADIAAGIVPIEKEELAAVASVTKAALGVVSGLGNRKIANTAIEKFQEQVQRPASVADAKPISVMMMKARAAIDKARRKSKWENTLDDDAAVRIAGPEAEEKAAQVRDRIEARSAEDYERRTASRRIVSQPKLYASPEPNKDAQLTVDATEVAVSGTGRTQSTQSTTPAPGTEQRKRIEEQLQELDEREVVVAAETRDAKLAVSVPPALPVQGRELTTTPQGSMGAVVHGDGRTVQTAIDFSLAPLMDKSNTSSTLVSSAVESIYQELRRSVNTFYDMYEMSAEDSEFRQNPVPYAKAFEQRVHQQIEEMFPKDGKRRADMRKFVKELFIGMPPTERKKKLLEQLSMPPAPRSEAEREALIDSVVFGSKAVAEPEDDVHEAAKQSAMRWQRDAEMTALQEQLHDVDEDVLAQQLSYDVDPNEHILLRMIREHASNDVLYRTSEEAPITLRRENETIYEGHHKSVVPEALKLSTILLNSNSFLDTLRMEETSRIHATKMRIDALMDESSSRLLTDEENDELRTLRASVREAEEAARRAHYQYIVQRCGHPDAAAAIESLQQRQILALEKVSRVHITQFIREPMGEKFGERPCRNELQCICNNLWRYLGFANDGDRQKRGFVCREFLLPSELARYRLEGERALPPRRKPCFFCELYQTTFMFFQRKEQRNNGGETLEVFQQFETIFDEPGEYDASACNLAAVVQHRSFGIVAGFPCFNAANYKYSHCSVTNPETSEIVTLQQLEEKPDILFH